MKFTPNKIQEECSNKIKKDMETIKSQISEINGEIADIENDISDFKTDVQTSDEELQNQITINKNDISELEDYVEDYVRNNKTLIETQVLRALDYVETNLLRVVDFFAQVVETVKLKASELTATLANFTNVTVDENVTIEGNLTVNGDAHFSSNVADKIVSHNYTTEEETDYNFKVLFDKEDEGNANVLTDGDFNYNPSGKTLNVGHTEKLSTRFKKNSSSSSIEDTNIAVGNNSSYISKTIYSPDGDTWYDNFDASTYTFSNETTLLDYEVIASTSYHECEYPEGSGEEVGYYSGVTADGRSILDFSNSSEKEVILKNSVADKANASESAVKDGNGDIISSTYQKVSEKGVANGYASLDATGRIPVSQLPVNDITFEGEWNAYTNTPTLADGTGTQGDFYIVSVAGSQDLGSGTIDFNVNDRIIYDGSVWCQLKAGVVDTVNGITPVNGNISIKGSDIPFSGNDSRDIATVVNSIVSAASWSGTISEYNAITDKNPDTLYIITA